MTINKLKRVMQYLCAYTVFMVPIVYAGTCEDSYQPSLEQLNNIEKNLQTTNTLEAYQQSVKERYDVVEEMLIVATTCSRNDQLSTEAMFKWEQLSLAFSSLQASAQASAFTKFKDWIAARETDLHACNKAIANNQADASILKSIEEKL